MVDYLNQFLALYMVPFIISYLYMRTQFKNRLPSIFDVIVVVTPFVNWITVLYCLMDLGAELLVNGVGACLEWSEDMLSKSDLIKRFFRMKE